MSQATEPRWKAMQDPDARRVEQVLRAEFPRSDAYRYNSASIRVRVVDERFARLSDEQRDDLVEPLLATLPEGIQRDIMNLLTATPEELQGSLRKQFANLEFEDPSPSIL